MQAIDLENPAESVQSPPSAAPPSKSPGVRQHAPVIAEPASPLPSPAPLKRYSRSATSLYTTTLTPPPARQLSPSGGLSLPGIASGLLGERGSPGLAADQATANALEPLSLILQSFVPHVAVITSKDTDALVKEKGLDRGLWELLRPFGDQVHGKVIIRDSNGAGRSCDDFSIRFVRFGEGVETPGVNLANPSLTQAAKGTATSAAKSKIRLQAADTLVARHLQYAEQLRHDDKDSSPIVQPGPGASATSPYYSLYLRRILSGLPLSPYSTFAHPVACIIAISSRNTSPIDELRRLYEETSQGDTKLPPWVSGEYLRYYVLVHDEDNDDISRSMALFEQMKRHLGLHCHLLRLRSNRCVESDDDSTFLPKTNWTTAAEELETITRSEDEDEDMETPHCIFDSDATAIRTFVREMVTQSIVPTMERNVALWNETVASRRRGIAGRLATFSKKWAGFGSSSPRPSSIGASGSATYDAQGFYGPETPEMTMRKLGDFAFMLRDYRLAHSTYDLVKGDFKEAKAWRHHAEATEMEAASLLFMPQHLSSKSRTEAIDQMLEASFYSYHARCGEPFGALRCLVVGMELLKLRGGKDVDDAAKWGVRLLESKIAGRVADALLKERITACYASRQASGSSLPGRRLRKAALWSILSAETWASQENYTQARKCLDNARELYSSEVGGVQIEGFALASDFIHNLHQHLAQKLDLVSLDDSDAHQGDSEQTVDEEREALDAPQPRQRANTLTSTAGSVGLETAPLRETTLNIRDDAPKPAPAQDDFS